MDNNLEISMVKLQKDIEYIMVGQDEVKKQQMKDNVQNNLEHAEIKELIKEWIETSDGRYSSKWVEKFFIWTAAAIGGVVIVGGLTLIARAYLFLF